MKRPVLTVIGAVGAFFLVLVFMGLLTSGETRIHHTTVLNGTPERIWPLFADLRGWPVWYEAPGGMPRMTGSFLVEGSASGLNTVRHAEDSNGDWWKEKVTAFEPNKHLELTGINTPGRYNWRQDITLTEVGQNQTRVDWTLEYNVRGPINKLINKSRTEEIFSSYMEGGLKAIAPLIPSAEEWDGNPNAATPPSPSAKAADSTAAPPQ